MIVFAIGMIYGITNLVWREMFGKKLFTKAGKKGMNFRSQKSLERFLNKNRNNSEVAKFVKDYYKNLTPHLQKVFVKNFLEKVGKNQSLQKYVKKLGDMANRITTKLSQGGKLTTHEKSFLDDYGMFLLPEKYQGEELVSIKSSYLQAGQYDKHSGLLKLWMIRGKGAYVFYNVPLWVWVHLTTLKGNAGSYWNTQWVRHALNSRYTTRN